MRSNGKAWHGWSASLVHPCRPVPYPVHPATPRVSLKSSESSQSTPTHSDRQRLILSVGGLVKWREAQRSGRHKEPPPWTNYKVGIPMYLRLMKVAHTGLRSRDLPLLSLSWGESSQDISHSHAMEAAASNNAATQRKSSVSRLVSSRARFSYTPKLEPQPHSSSALGLKNLNPPPINSSE